MDRWSVSHAPRVNRWSAPYTVPSNLLPPRSIASRIHAALLSMRTPPPRGGTSLVLPSHQTRDGIEGKLRMHHIGPGLQRTSQLHHPQTCLLTTSPVRLLTLTKPYVQREVHGEPATTLLSKSSQNSDLLGGREVTHLSLKQDEFNIFHQRCKQLHVRNEVRRKHIGRGAEQQAAVGGPATHDTTTPSAPTAANSIVARASSWEAPNTSPPTPSRCR